MPPVPGFRSCYGGEQIHGKRDLALRMGSDSKTVNGCKSRSSQSGKMAGFELPGDRTWRPCKTGYAGGGRRSVKGINDMNIRTPA